MGTVVLSLPGIIYEQVQHIKYALGDLQPIHNLQLYSMGLISYGALMLKTLALQLSKGVSVLIMR